MKVDVDVPDTDETVEEKQFYLLDDEVCFCGKNHSPDGPEEK